MIEATVMRRFRMGLGRSSACGGDREVSGFSPRWVISCPSKKIRPSDADIGQPADHHVLPSRFADEAEGFAILMPLVHGLEQPFGLAASVRPTGKYILSPRASDRAHSRFPSPNDARRARPEPAVRADIQSSPAALLRCSWHPDSAPRTDSPAKAQSGRAAREEWLFRSVSAGWAAYGPELRP